MMGENYTIALIVNNEKIANEISKSLIGTNVNIEPIFDVISAIEAVNKKKYHLIVAFENTPIGNAYSSIKGVQHLVPKRYGAHGHLVAPQTLFNHVKKSEYNKDTTYVTVTSFLNSSVPQATNNLRLDLPGSIIVVENEINNILEKTHISKKIMEYLTQNKA